MTRVKETIRAVPVKAAPLRREASTMTKLDLELELLRHNLIDYYNEFAPQCWVEWNGLSKDEELRIRQIGAQPADSFKKWVLVHLCLAIAESSKLPHSEDKIMEILSTAMDHRPATIEEFDEVMDQDVVDPSISLDEAKRLYRELMMHCKNIGLELLEIRVEQENARNVAANEPKTPELPKEDAATNEVLISLQIENAQLKQNVAKWERCCEELTAQALEDERRLRELDQIHINQANRLKAAVNMGNQLRGEVHELAKENSALESDLMKVQHRVSEQMIIIETLRREKEIADNVQREKAKEEVERQEAFAVARAEREKRRKQVREREVDLDLAAADTGEKRLRRSLMSQLNDEVPEGRIFIREHERNPRRTQLEMLEDQTKRYLQFKK